MLLDPNPTDGGAPGAETPTPEVKPSVGEQLNATKPQPLQRPQAPRQATETEKKQTFATADAIAEELGIEQLPAHKPSDAAQSNSSKPTVKPTPEAVVPPAAGAAAASTRSEAKRSDGEPAAGESDPSIIKVSKPAGQQTFDYSGYTQDEVTILKNMSVQSREHVSKLMKDAKRLSQEVKQASYLQHPNAYVLDPEYQNLQTEKFFADKEADYWKRQLALIKSGENWRPVIKWNNDGTPVLGDERPPTNEHEEAVRLAMNECYQLGQGVVTKAQQYAQTQQQRIVGDLQAINQEQARRFEWVADPEKMNHKIEIPGMGPKTINEVKSDFVNMFPSYHRNTAGVDVAANLFVAVQILATRLREAEGQKKVAEIHAEEVRRAEPTSTVRPPSQKAIRGVGEFSLEGMP